VQARRYGLHAKREWEANLFAAELLMPAEQVQVMFRVVKGSLFKLSRHFKVSPQAMEIRLKSLELAAVS
jgi:Zn-dependent peptidase ImmA (M78 family)